MNKSSNKSTRLVESFEEFVDNRSGMGRYSIQPTKTKSSLDDPTIRRDIPRHLEYAYYNESGEYLYRNEICKTKFDYKNGAKGFVIVLYFKHTVDGTFVRLGDGGLDSRNRGETGINGLFTYTLGTAKLSEVNQFIHKVKQVNGDCVKMGDVDRYIGDSYGFEKFNSYEDDEDDVMLPDSVWLERQKENVDRIVISNILVFDATWIEKDDEYGDPYDGYQLGEIVQDVVIY